MSFKQYLAEQQYKEPPMSITRNNPGHNPSGPGWISSVKFLNAVKALGFKKVKDMGNRGNDVMSEYGSGRFITVDEAKAMQEGLEDLARKMQFQRGTYSDIPWSLSGESPQIVWWKDFTMTKEFTARKVHYLPYAKYKVNGFDLYSAHSSEVRDDDVTEGPVETFYASSVKRYWFTFRQTGPSTWAGFEGKVSVSMYAEFPAKADVAAYLYHITPNLFVVSNDGKTIKRTRDVI